MKIEHKLSCGTTVVVGEPSSNHISIYPPDVKPRADGQQGGNMIVMGINDWSHFNDTVLKMIQANATLNV